MNVLLIPLVLAVVIALSLAGFAGWLYVQYTDARDNVQSKVDVAVAEARQDQQEKDAKAEAERRKEPYEIFVGPDDLGRVEFQYPKTWSVYIGDEGTDGFYLAALHPKEVHPIESFRPYAVKLEIVPDGYQTVIGDFQGLVAEGDLRSRPVVVNGFEAVELSGKFSEEVPNGKMTIFRSRDKTVKLSTEAPQFFADYQNIILESFRFNP